jgi:hypothetical protein
MTVPEDRAPVATYLLTTSLVSTVLLFTLRLSGAAQLATAALAIGGAGYVVVRFVIAPLPSGGASGRSRGPGWLTWVLTPFAVWLLLATARTDGSGATVSAVGLLVTVSVLVIGADEAVRAAHAAALTLVAASLVVSLADPRYVVVGARDFLPVLYDGRAFGLLQHPNGLGQMSALLFMLAWNRRSGAGFLISVGGLMAAASQTALIAVLAAVCAVYAARLARSLASRYRAAVVALGTGALLLLVWLTQARVLTVATPSLSQDDLTLTHRTLVWQQLSAGGVPPLGLGGDGLAARIAARTTVGSAHNMWLEAWLRDGFVGILALVVAAAVLVGASRRGTDVSLGIGALALLLVEGMTESSPAHPIFFPFYVALVVGGAASVRGPLASDTSAREQRAPRAVRIPAS